MYSLGSNDGDTTFVEVKRCNKQLIIQDQNSFSGELIPGISTDITYVDYEKDSAYYQMSYSDGDAYYSSFPIQNKNVSFTEEGKEMMNGYQCKKYRTSINSNTIEVWMTESLGYDATPSISRGVLKGVMIRQAINGNRIFELKNIKKDRKLKNESIPSQLGKRVSSRDIDKIHSDGSRSFKAIRLMTVPDPPGEPLVPAWLWPLLAPLYLVDSEFRRKLYHLFRHT